MKYFSNLHNGWADLTIGDFTCQCSYIQNIPLVILNAWNNFKNNKHCIISIDSEGNDNEIIITNLGIHAIVYRGFIEYHDLNKYFKTFTDKVELLKDLAKDIIDNIDEWAKWLCITDPNTLCYNNIIEEYKKNVLSYAEKIGFKS